ncbi:uncharacterized protein LOC130635916 [Hydractinia symbiolongicarpus]|uniref:uncharacterized protein LOC130635916 n=1 Tax=Hydractinia symbiolongicarpus TaxID=13093 RepID=UPI002550F138|nr:uncharacterized protein LOC130635916 [Hydractinia symbiolongicarpus]
MDEGEKRHVIHVVEVTYTKSLILVLLFWITIVDGRIDVTLANNKKEASKGKDCTVYWNISNLKTLYQLKLYKNKTIIKSGSPSNWISTEFFTVNKTSFSIKGFMEGDKMRCMMTIHNVSYADDASEYVIK